MAQATAAPCDYVNRHFNQDCVAGAKQHLPDESVDLLITDPPYAIAGDTLHKHYHRKESYVLPGYTEINPAEYAAFSLTWIKQAERVLKKNGSLYIVSGYTHLRDLLNALAQTRLQLVNHLIWKYNFGVFTKRKYVSSHYHLLYFVKGKNYTFNLECRHSLAERSPLGRSLNYQDREDVWTINREYKPGKKKNKNQLPTALLRKLIAYSSNEGDLVCDFFLGSFSTSFVALEQKRRVCGFEINPAAFAYFNKKIKAQFPQVH